jgi:AcrR family transcriptional regulator
MSEQPTGEMTGSRRGGRRRDESRNVVILESALDVLAEAGYEGTTIDAVAARAGAARATVYRRWPTKLDLVLDALRALGPDRLEPTDLPDTGDLREDLLSMTQPDTAEEALRRVRVVSGLQAAAAREPRLSQVLASGGTGPWIETSRALIQRAVDRGDYSDVDVDALAQVLPLMCTSRAAIQQLPITPEYVASLVDGVLIPALRGASRPAAQR